MNKVTRLGYVLSGASSEYAKFQLLKEAEPLVKEGLFVLIESSNRRERYLAVIDKVVRYHEFYEEGEVWSEALRYGRKPPDEIARKYTIARVKILGKIEGNTLRSSDKPPLPGSVVLKVLGDELSQMYGSKILEKGMGIDIGTIYGYEDSEEHLPAILDLRALTMHLAIIGVTGSGKSNTVGMLIEKLGKHKGKLFNRYRTIPVMVVDANGDYVDYYEKPELVPSFSKVVRFVSAESYESLYTSLAHNNKGNVLNKVKINLNIFTPSELAELIIAFYRSGRIEGAELQINYLSTLLSSLPERLKKSSSYRCFIDADQVDYNCVLCRELNTIHKLIDDDIHDNIVHSQTANAVRRALEKFHEELVSNARIVPKYSKDATLGGKFIDELTDYDRPGLAIIDFSSEGAISFNLEVKQFIVYYLLSLLYSKFTSYRIMDKNRLLLFVLEEAQNYAPNEKNYPVGFSIAKRVLASVATQGRKFGLCLCIVTQRPLYVDSIVMSMMNTYIIHRVAPNDLRFIDQLTGGLPSYIKSKLTLMERGLAVITGQMNVLPYRILARIYKRESHRMGGVGFS